jgi:hypothetical protein
LERGVDERTRDRARGTGAFDGGACDRQKIGTPGTGGAGQLTLFGSDQADKRVTKSNSRSSFATTWSASALVDNESTCEITLTRADSTLLIA